MTKDERERLGRIRRWIGVSNDVGNEVSTIIDMMELTKLGKKQNRSLNASADAYRELSNLMGLEQ